MISVPYSVFIRMEVKLTDFSKLSLDELKKYRETLAMEIATKDNKQQALKIL